MTSLSFTNLRIFIEEDVHPIYTSLTRGTLENKNSQDRAENIPFIKMPDLFMAAACAGVKENIYRDLGTKKRDIFVADAFDTKTQIPILIALAYKKNHDLDDLSDPKKILNICEGWANGGIHLINEEILSGEGLRPLYRLIDFIIKTE